MVPAEKELDQLRQQLSEHYTAIANMYKRMAKTIDAHSLRVLDTGIEGRLISANELREKIETLKRDMFTQWEQHKKDNPPPTTPSDPKKAF